MKLVVPGVLALTIVACAEPARDPSQAAADQRKQVEKEIRTGQLDAPPLVVFTCEGRQEPLSASFYNQTNPKSVAIKFGAREGILLAAPSGSGARYIGADVEFWEHQGEATVTWGGTIYKCRP